MAEATSSPDKTSKLPLSISSVFIGSMLALYFFNPAFQSIIKEAWSILTSGNQGRISEWVSQFGFWGPLFIILFMAVQMFLVVVNSVALIVVAILAYGPIWGSFISLIAVLFASSVGYWLGRVLGQATAEKLLGASTRKKIEEQVEHYGIWAVVLARISPLISNDAISIVAGLARMPYLRFMLATTGGIIPLIILIAYLGNDMDRLKTGLIIVTAVGVVMLVCYYLYNRARSDKNKV